MERRRGTGSPQRRRLQAGPIPGYLWSITSLDVWVRVRFTEPVEGPGSYTLRRTTDDRHEFKCQWLRHQGDESLFGTGDEVVERWLTQNIEMIEWRVDDAVPRQASQRGLSLAERRLAVGASRLGAPWTDEEDAQLREEYASGMQLDDMANVRGRNLGGIRSRLIRLELESRGSPAQVSSSRENRII